MLYLLYSLNGLLMIAMPLLLGRAIAARRGARWGLFGIGAATFLLSQVGHIPFNLLVGRLLEGRLASLPAGGLLAFNALFLGLSAGLWEEIARYLAYRHWARDARTWGRGLMLGAGHGGAEAIVLGGLAFVNFWALAAIRSGFYQPDIPPDQLPLLQARLDAVFGAAWYDALLGALERLFTLCFHLSASLLVLQAVVRGRLRWLVAAIVWHTTLNATAVVAIALWNVYVAEALIGLGALVSLAIIVALRQPEPVAAPPEPLPQPGAAAPAVVPTTAERLERSRYQ